MESPMEGTAWLDLQGLLNLGDVASYVSTRDKDYCTLSLPKVSLRPVVSSKSFFLIPGSGLLR